MNELEDKKDLINQLLLALTLNGEMLKSTGSIVDYTLETDMQNLSVAPDGVLEYDVHIDFTVQAKVSSEHVKINLTI